MKAHTEGDRVVAGGDARQRFHDNSGYGEPRDGELLLSAVEAAHLLDRGELDGVDGDDAAAYRRRMERRDPSFRPALAVYADLRERGFYPGHDPATGTIPLPERGTVPAAATAPRTVDPRSERGSVEVAALGDRTVAVLDDDGDVTYLRTTPWDGGGAAPDVADVLRDADATVPDAGLPADAVGDSVVLAPGAVADALRGRLYLGAPAPEGLRLAPAEAAYLDDVVGLDVELGDLVDPADSADVAVYADLRRRGLVPRTGFKFGADLRAYESPDPGDEDHSELLFRAVTADTVPVRELARYARLARGVRKRAVFALTDAGATPRYVAVERDRP